MGNVLIDASDAEKQAAFEFVTVAWLEKHLRQFVSLAPDVSVAGRVLDICSSFLVEPGFEEAMRPLCHYFAIALSLLSTLPSSEDLIDMAEYAAQCLGNSALEAATTHNSVVAIALVHSQPGALASMAFLAAMRPPVSSAEEVARHLMRVFCAPPGFVEGFFPSLLDSAFTLPALCSVPYETEDAARLLEICTTRTALHFLTQPLPHHRVCTAASLAHLANLDERFVKHLADNKHLETLLDAVFEDATSPGDAASMPGGCSREWHTDALLAAVADAALACDVAAVAAATEGEDEMRRELLRMGLDASDVGVQHHSTTTFLITSQPFHVNSQVMEKASSVLKEAMETAGDRREPISLPLTIDAPSDRHHALFGLAVVFAYTGAISRLSDDDALPLYTLAEFLQIDALRSYLLDTRLRRFMHADVAFTERVWAASMTFPALQEAAATAIVGHLSHRDVPLNDVGSLLRRCHDASAAQPNTTLAAESAPHLRWIFSFFAQTMRSALRARVAAAAGGAA